MATIEALIFRGLSARVNSLGLGLPIAWPNVGDSPSGNFTPPADGRYLEVAFVPNIALRVAISSGTPHRRLGLLQISVWAPRGSGFPAETAGLVAEHFPADLTLTSGGVFVRITKEPDVAGLIVDDRGVQVPVTIDWEALA